jgi:hypothetical protein
MAQERARPAESNEKRVNGRKFRCHGVLI